jgi:hypothetical protein
MNPFQISDEWSRLDLWLVSHKFSKLNTILCVTFLTFSVAPKAFAGSLGIGFTAVEEQDERHRPAITLLGEPVQDWQLAGSIYGQKYETVRQTSLVASMVRTYALPKSHIFFGGVGFAALWDRWRFSDDADSNQDSGNFGMALLASARFPKQSKYKMSLDWTAHLFPAGIGTIFLVTARRQTISLTTRVAL